MNMLRDISHGWPYLRPILEIPPRQPLVCGEEFGESKILKLSNYIEDNITKVGADKQFQSLDLRLENMVANDDLLVMNKDLTNKETW
jgi:hypothetical protein